MPLRNDLSIGYFEGESIISRASTSNIPRTAEEQNKIDLTITTNLVFPALTESASIAAVRTGPIYSQASAFYIAARTYLNPEGEYDIASITKSNSLVASLERKELKSWAVNQTIEISVTANYRDVMSITNSQIFASSLTVTASGGYTSGERRIQMLVMPIASNAGGTQTFLQNVNTASVVINTSSVVVAVSYVVDWNAGQLPRMAIGTYHKP
jgi:hypothetical protein